MDELPQDIPSPFDETQGGDVQEPAFVINRADDRAEAEQTEETNMWGAESIALDSEVNDEEQVSVSPAKKKTTKQDIREIAAETQNVEAEIKEKEEQPKPVYKIPPLRLLKRGKKGGGDSDAHLRATALKLEQTLQNFGVKVHVTNASCGPSVTRYELQPEQGVKVSKIVGLADDIKLNLAAADIRIEAPIPGKAAVGIEVPNQENTAVMLRDLLEYRGNFKKFHSEYSVCRGKRYFRKDDDRRYRKRCRIYLWQERQDPESRYVSIR